MENFILWWSIHKYWILPMVRYFFVRMCCTFPLNMCSIGFIAKTLSIWLVLKQDWIHSVEQNVFFFLFFSCSFKDFFNFFIVNSYFFTSNFAMDGENKFVRLLHFSTINKLRFPKPIIFSGPCFHMCISLSNWHRFNSLTDQVLTPCDFPQHLVAQVQI